MVFNVVAAAVFGAVSLHMIAAAKCAVTRRMVWIPFSMSAMELAMCGALAMGDYPVFTAILMLCRVTVLSCCALSMKRDAAMVRNRRRRREVWRRVAYDKTAEAKAISMPRCA